MCDRSVIGSTGLPGKRGNAVFNGQQENDAMKKFMVLYKAPVAQFEEWMKNVTPEQQKKGMEGWMKWMSNA
jgi:hypothetical protein